MRTLSALRVIAVALVVVLTQIRMPARTNEDDTSVMTRNLYLGADLTPVIAATTPQEFFQAVSQVLGTIAATNFPERANRLAQEIAEKRPHLVGLQEVFQFTLNDATGAPPFRDLLDDLLSGLTAQGAEYYVVGRVHNLDVTIQVPNLGRVRALGRDVVLARGDVSASTVAVPGCRVSQDGCNYKIIAPLPSLAGPINSERGFLVVDAAVGGQAFRFVNTHLEIPELPRVVQAAQASELIARLETIAQPGLPVVIVGDINSAPTDGDVIIPGGVIGSPYKQLTAAGYSDTWTLRAGNAPGLTCCQSTDVSNASSELFKRVDMIFARAVLSEVHANLVGNDPEDRTPSGLWPSDHAGVIARLRFGQ